MQDLANTASKQARRKNTNAQSRMMEKKSILALDDLRTIADQGQREHQKRAYPTIDKHGRRAHTTENETFPGLAPNYPSTKNKPDYAQAHTTTV